MARPAELAALAELAELVELGKAARAREGEGGAALFMVVAAVASDPVTPFVVGQDGAGDD